MAPRVLSADVARGLRRRVSKCGVVVVAALQRTLAAP